MIWRWVCWEDANGVGETMPNIGYEQVRGMTLTDAGKVRNTEIARELCLPPVKRMSSPPALNPQILLQIQS